MPLNQNAIKAKEDAEQRKLFLEANKSRIRHWVSLSAKEVISESDDAFSEGLIAFNNAIDAFDPKKGRFLPFAKTAVQNRITDFYRKEARHSHVLPFSSLAVQDENGTEIPFDICDPHAEISDAALEIAALTLRLKAFSISFAELAKTSPRTRKTRSVCRKAVKVLLEEKELLSILKKKKQLPMTELIKKSELPKPVLERYRKYIITGVLIKTEQYPILTEYFNGGKEETP